MKIKDTLFKNVATKTILKSVTCFCIQNQYSLKPSSAVLLGDTTWSTFIYSYIFFHIFAVSLTWLSSFHSIFEPQQTNLTANEYYTAQLSWQAVITHMEIQTQRGKNPHKNSYSFILWRYSCQIFLQPFSKLVALCQDSLHLFCSPLWEKKKRAARVCVCSFDLVQRE